MEKSESIGKLALALAKAQSEIKGASKDSVNPFFKSSYADLESVWSAIREPLSKNELSVIQSTKVLDTKLVVVTVLAHSSGEWISGEYPILSTKNDAQGLGSGTSYARRYALASMVGVYQTDDDANHAVAPAKPQVKEYEKKETKEYIINFGKKYKGKKLSDLTDEQIEHYCFELSEFEKASNKPLDSLAVEFINLAKKRLKK